MERDIAIDMPQGFLAAKCFSAVAPRAFAVFNPATGVPQSYYRHFAAWLAEHENISVLTYDYRGFGASSDGPMRHVDYRMDDWGIHDQQAARDWADKHASGLPLWVIGHSLGAFMLGYQTGLERIARVVGIASGPIHVRHHPWPYQASARFFWYMLGPALVGATGYLPGRYSGLGVDLPGPVFRQWKRWCTTHGFHRADPDLPEWNADALIAPLRSVALSDDVMIPAPVVARLGGLYTRTSQTHVTLDPGDHGLGKVGHLGAFRRRNAALWPLIIGPH